MTSPAAATTPNNKTFSSASLYVGDLAPDVTEALLFDIFHAVGPVASVRVCRDAATRRSLGYAYVNFHNANDADRALDTMNFTLIRDRPCRVMWSHRDPTLRKSGVGNVFVKNLVPTMDNKSLYDTFSIFGNILSCKVATNEKGESLGYGFVHYESEESATSAIDAVNGKMIGGLKVSVERFKSKRERGDQIKFTNVYVKNLPPETTVEQLRERFSKFGPITSAVLPIDEEKKAARGFAFVNYENPDDAAAAVRETNDSEWDGKKLYVSRAQKKEERERELRSRFDMVRLARQRTYAGVNLYVKNLADKIDKDRLIQEFSKFGSISSAVVMMDGEKSRGFGFVCFSSPEEATRAVTEMNGKMLDNKPLYVALAQRKEVRRAQLEAQRAARARMAMQPMFAPQGAPLFYPPGPMPGMFAQPQQMPRRPMHAMGPAVYGMPPNSAAAVAAGGPVVAGGAPVHGGQPRGGRQGGRQGGAGQRNFSYTTHARNQGRSAHAHMSHPGAAPGGAHSAAPSHQAVAAAAAVAAQGAVPSGPQGGAAPATPAGAGQAGQKESLTIQELVNAPEDVQKQLLGERLFHKIQPQQPKLAGKITGMLLEMETGELLDLLDSQEALQEKIQEALEVLEHHAQGGAVDSEGAASAAPVATN